MELPFQNTWTFWSRPGRHITVHDVYFHFVSCVQYCPPLWTCWIWVSLVREDTAKTERAHFLLKAHHIGRSQMKQNWSKWTLNRVFPVPAHLKKSHWTQVLNFWKYCKAIRWKSNQNDVINRCCNGQHITKRRQYQYISITVHIICSCSFQNMHNADATNIGCVLCGLYYDSISLSKDMASFCLHQQFHLHWTNGKSSTHTRSELVAESGNLREDVHQRILVNLCGKFYKTIKKL